MARRKKSSDEIIALVESRNPHKRTLGFRFAGQQACYAVLPHSIDALRDDNSDVRVMAAWLLDRLCSPVAIPDLLEALADPVFDVRSHAGWALVHIAQRMTPELVVPDVIDVLVAGETEEARHMAYLVLYHIGGEVAEDAIKRYWLG